MVETRTAYINWREDGILHVVYKQGVHVTGKDAKDNLSEGKKIAKASKILTLVDIRGIVTIDREARQVFAEESFSYAETIVFGSIFSKLIADFYIRLKKPKFLIKLFISETEAIQWLKDISND